MNSGANRNGTSNDEPLAQAHCLEELGRILSDHRFAHSPSLSRFLEYVVSQTLGGNGNRLKESLLGTEVFARGEGFDPRIDPIVRVQATKLRNKLQEYYAHEGAQNPIRIEIPKGSYATRFVEATHAPLAPLLSPPESAPVGTSFEPRTSTREPEPGNLALHGQFPSPPTHLPSAPATMHQPGEPARSHRWPTNPLLLATLALIGIGLVTLMPRRPAAPSRDFLLTRLTFHEGATTFPAISRDGKWIAYSSDQASSVPNIWLQPLAGGEARKVTDHGAATLAPDFAPDARQIVFQSRRDGGIYVIGADGSGERRLVDRGWHPRFSPDGNWISCLGPKAGAGGRILLVPSAGSGLHEIFTGQVAPLSAPIWSPDGQHLLFLGEELSGGSRLDWYAVPWTGGEPVRLRLREAVQQRGLPPLGPESMPWDWAGDVVVFSLRSDSRANIWTVPISRTLRIDGAIAPITSGAAMEAHPRLALSRQIIFASEQLESHVFSLPVEPTKSVATGEPRRLTVESGIPGGLVTTISGDGTKIAFTSASMGSTSLIVQDLETRREIQRIALRNPVERPLLSADGSIVLFRFSTGDDRRLQVARNGGLTPREPIGMLHDWSRDGKWVLAEDPTRTRLLLRDWETGVTRTWLDFPHRSLGQAGISPDLRWVVLYYPNVGAYVVPFDEKQAPHRNQWLMVTGDGTVDSLYWSANGRDLYFLSRRDGHRCLWAYRFNPDGPSVRQEPVAVHHFHHNQLSSWSGWLGITPNSVLMTLTHPKASLWLAKPVD